MDKHKTLTLILDFNNSNVLATSTFFKVIILQQTDVTSRTTQRRLGGKQI